MPLIRTELQRNGDWGEAEGEINVTEHIWNVVIYQIPRIFPLPNKYQCEWQLTHSDHRSDAPPDNILQASANRNEQKWNKNTTNWRFYIDWLNSIHFQHESFWGVSWAHLALSPVWTMRQAADQFTIMWYKHPSKAFYRPNWVEWLGFLFERKSIRQHLAHADNGCIFTSIEMKLFRWTPAVHGETSFKAIWLSPNAISHYAKTKKNRISLEMRRILEVCCNLVAKNVTS